MGVAMQDTDYAVTRLTETHTITVGDQAAECGALLIELREARYPNLGGTKSGGGTGDLLDMKALTMYETIDAGVRSWLDHYRQTQPADLTDAAKRLYETLKAERAGGRLDPDDPLFAMFPTWVQRIEDMFDPPREYELTSACPECGTEHATGEDGGQRWAVRVPVKEGRALVAECHECGTMWAGQDRLTELAERMQIDINWVALREALRDAPNPS